MRPVVGWLARLLWLPYRFSRPLGAARWVISATAAIQMWRHRGMRVVQHRLRRHADHRPGQRSVAWPRLRHQRWRRRHAGAQTSLREVEMETWDAIRSRRNVRSYGEQAIAPEDLERILEAARRAPSAGNQQAWDFVVCTDREQLIQLARVWRAARHVASSAATIALVAPSSDDARMRDLIQFDLGQATMSAMLAAADLGIGSAHAGVHDQDLVRRLLGVPEDRFCALLITLGAPADRPLTPIQRPDRRPFTDVVHRGHW
jgi:nitroreductase